MKWFSPITLFFCFQCSFGQDYQCPDPLVIGDLEANNYTVIYPFGWSKNGHFAYIQQDINGLSEAEYFRYEFHIIDINNADFNWNSADEAPYYSKEYGADSLFSLKMDTLDLGSDYWYSNVMKLIVWPEWKKQIIAALEEKKIAQMKVDYEEFVDGSCWGFEMSEIQEFSGEGDMVMILYELNHVEAGQMRKCFSAVGELNEEGLGTDVHGNEIWYRSFRFEGMIKSPFESDNRPYIILIIESTDGHEEPWEYLHTKAFVPN
jgi:hypothetical protein